MTDSDPNNPEFFRGIDGAIREAARKPEGELTREDYCKIVSLSFLGNTNDADVGKLAEVKNLKFLELHYCEKITGEKIKQIYKLRQLKSLCLRGVTDKLLKGIADLTQITSLDLSYNKKLTDEGIKELVKLKQLEEINLRQCTRVTSTALSDLVKLPSLTKLDLWYTNVSDEGLEQLVNLTKLTFLRLGKTLITEKCLADLAKLRQLQALCLRGAPRIQLAPYGRAKSVFGLKKKDVIWLREALPDCLIDHSKSPCDLGDLADHPW